MYRAIAATRWKGLRDVYGSRFLRFCSYLSDFNKSSSDSTRFDLLGPPEIHKLNTCLSDYTRPPLHETPLREMFIISFKHPCMDLFTFINFKQKRECYLPCLLEESWNHDSLTTLKIICYMKRYSYAVNFGREKFLTAAFWLHYHHPKTLACNVEVFAKFGCLKDLLEILYRLVEGPQIRQKEIMERKRVTRERQIKLLAKRSGNEGARHDRMVTRREEDNQENMMCSREEKRLKMAKKAIEVYNSDPDYRFLYCQISDIFAQLLRSDLELLDSGDLGKISLAAKWCPSIYSSYDRSILFCESVAKRLFPYDSNPEYKGIEEAHYAYRVRDSLRRQILVPLRRALKLPETYMSSNKWNLLPYDRVGLIAMRTYKGLFSRHDRERFLQYIQDSNGQKPKISTSSCTVMFPHDILSLLDCYRDGREVAEVQWRRMVEDFADKGKFVNCIVCCCLNELNYLPRLVQNFCAAFQLLASDLSDGPWKGKILGCRPRENPQFFDTEGVDVQSKIGSMRSGSYGCAASVDVGILLEKILETAVCCNLSREMMIRRVFVLSETPHAMSPSQYTRRLEATREKFERCGYPMPDVVAWHLDGHSMLPYVWSEMGFTFISCFSRIAIEKFFETDGKVEPLALFESVISDEDYMKLKVVD